MGNIRDIVYVVTYTGIDDWCDKWLRTTAFKSKDKAIEYFNALVEEEKSNIDKAEWEDGVDTEMNENYDCHLKCFTICEYGHYSKNHADIFLDKEVVR